MPINTKLLWVSACFFITLISACNNASKKQLAVFKLLNDGIQSSTKNLESQNDIVYKTFANKLVAPETRERTLQWEPKYTSIKNHSSLLIKYIDSLQDVLKDKAGYTKGNQLNETNTSAANWLFEDKGAAESLFKKLNGYKFAVLAVDEEIKKVFEDRITLAPTFGKREKDGNTATNFFNGKSVMEVQAILNQFKNGIRLTENEIITFCNYKCEPFCNLMFGKFSAIVGQSSTYVKPGDEIKILAGVGVFSVAAQPKIKINGNYILLNENGVAEYSLKAAGKPGKHTIPVTVNFIKSDGSKASQTYSIEYVVSKSASY
jgi:GldM N-terminal domain